MLVQFLWKTKANHSRGSVFEAVSTKYRSTIYRLPMLLPKIHIDLKVYDIQ